MTHRRQSLLLTPLLVLWAASVHAHDVWLAADSGSVKVGETLVVRQFVGIELDPEEELPLIRRATSRFELIAEGTTEDLLKGLPSEREMPVVRPVLARTMSEPGLALVAMSHDFIHGEFSPNEFAEYLEHEEFGPGEIPWKQGQRAVERERYARSLKCLAAVGDGRGDLHQRVVGQRLEILLAENPYHSAIGDPIHVRILFDGKPLGNKLVKAFHRQGSGPVTQFRARTDAEGTATFRLTAHGQWLIRLVHIRSCADAPGSHCEDYDWESDWSSFTFDKRP